MAAKTINDHQFSVHAMPQWALMVFHSIAVGIVVNGVLRTLWINVGAAKPIARSASINDHSTACYARAVQNIDEH